MVLRIPASAASVRPGLTALPKTPFPPAELKTSVLNRSNELRSVKEWASIQPPAPSALSALSARLAVSTPSASSSSASSISSKISPQLLQQALTHPSCLTTFERYYPTSERPPTNGGLSAVGNSLLGLFASEFLYTNYPHLPTRVLKTATSAFVGPRTLADVSREWGASPLLRWGAVVEVLGSDGRPEKLQIARVDALASFPRALIALISQHLSFAAARDFAHAHFLSRSVDLESYLKWRSPQISLAETVNKYGRERPISRLLSESGRYTNTPVFVVGIYSGQDKLGEGFGNSLKMAEFRAAENALQRLYLTRTPSHLAHVPSSTFPPTFSAFAPPPPSKSKKSPSNSTFLPPDSDFLLFGEDYRPPELGDAEVAYASASGVGRARSPSVRKIPNPPNLLDPDVLNQRANRLVQGKDESVEDFKRRRKRAILSDAIKSGVLGVDHNVDSIRDPYA